MSRVVLSTTYVREEIERKAYAYGVSPFIASLLGEHAACLLREAAAEQNAVQLQAAAAA